LAQPFPHFRDALLAQHGPPTLAMGGAIAVLAYRAPAEIQATTCCNFRERLAAPTLNFTLRFLFSVVEAEPAAVRCALVIAQSATPRSQPERHVGSQASFSPPRREAVLKSTRFAGRLTALGSDPLERLVDLVNAVNEWFELLGDILAEVFPRHRHFLFVQRRRRVRRPGGQPLLSAELPAASRSPPMPQPSAAPAARAATSILHIVPVDRR